MSDAARTNPEFRDELSEFWKFFSVKKSEEYNMVSI